MHTPLTLSRMPVLLSWAAAVAVYGQAGPMKPTTFPAAPSVPVRADLQAERTIIQVGQPVWVRFSVTNITGEPVTVKVPNSPASNEALSMMGLPLAHVFSGATSGGLIIKDARSDEWDADFSWRPPGPVPVIRLAPFSSVGARVDLTQYFRSMRRPGKYTLIWRPYLAEIESAPLTLTIMAERQAVINTEFGTMTIRFYFDQAPNTVENFTELVERRFYDRLTFHKIYPQAYIQGGDPRGDGRGGRPDGKRIKAEFSSIPFVAGTVGMARLPSDPDSASSQFFITTTRQPSFDGNQTAFGYLVGDESFKTLERIAAVPTDENGRPRNPVVMRTVTLENVPGREQRFPGPAEWGRPVATRPAIMSGGTGGAGSPEAGVAGPGSPGGRQ